MKLYKCGVLTLALLMPAAALADFQYQETTQITGGSLLNMVRMMGHFSRGMRDLEKPTVSNVYVQGNRMARIDPNMIQIIDLDKQTITTAYPDKQVYTVMTFDQMRQQIEQAAQKMKEAQSQQKSNPQTAQPDNVDMQFKVNVRNTGATKQISGLNTNEAILTLQLIGTDQTNGQQGAFAITSDMWLTPEISGYQELRDFQVKMAKELGNVFNDSGIPASMTAMYPSMKQGMSDMAKEGEKLKGIPVQQVIRMGATANGEPLPAASEAPLPPDSGPQMPSVNDMAAQSANNVTNQAESNATGKLASHMGSYGGSALSGFSSGLGGFGGFGHKKKKAAPAPETQPADNNNDANAAAAKTASVLIESQSTMEGFSSTPIDSSKFSVPAGFRQVDYQTMER